MKARKTYKFRMFPTKAQEKTLVHTLNLCRELYNAALQERRDAYKMVGKSISLYDQQNQLPEIKEVREDLKDVYAQVLQDVLRRLDKAFKAFFDRVKRGDTPGFPRFKSRDRFDSFTYPQAGWCLKNNKLILSKIGSIRFNLHREVLGKVKTVTIRRDGLNWFVCFSVEYEFEQPVHEGPVIGIDVGLENFANLSNGEQAANPRFYRKSEKHLAGVQRRWAKVKNLKEDDKKLKLKKAIICAHKKVSNQRKDFQHKLSHELASRFSLIVVEDLQVDNLSKRPKPKQDEATGAYLPNGASAKGGLNKSINDAGWSSFINMLSYKVEETGSKLIKVDPKYTSQICPGCGAIKKKELSQRWHLCECGASIQRDIAAAQVILARGQMSLSTQSLNSV
jgi:putative transposase